MSGDVLGFFQSVVSNAFDQFLSKFLASVVKNNINGNMQLQHPFYVSGAEFTMLLVRKCYLRLSGLFR